LDGIVALVKKFQKKDSSVKEIGLQVVLHQNLSELQVEYM
jgi:hypothetical protein